MCGTEAECLEDTKRRHFEARARIGQGLPPRATPPAMDLHRERMQLVFACDARGHRLGCGCNDRRFCSLGRGMFASEPCAVTLSDCLRCVSGQ